MTNTEVVDRGIIKFPFPGDDLNLLPCNLFIEGKCFRLLTIIFYNNNLIIPIACLFSNRIQTFFQRFRLILIWNNDRYKWFPADFIFYPVKSKIFRMLYSSLCTTADKMFLNCTLSRIKRIHLASRIICS